MNRFLSKNIKILTVFTILLCAASTKFSARNISSMPPNTTSLPKSKTARTPPSDLPVVDIFMAACTGNSGIGGNVFQDTNNDGIGAASGSGEPKISGIKVYAYDCNGTKVDSTLTDNQGDYLFNTTSNGGQLLANGTYRIEFVLANSLQPASAGTDNGTTIQFVTEPDCANLAITAATSGCPANPILQQGEIIATCATLSTTDYVMGVFDPTALSLNTATQTPPVYHHSDWTVGNLGNIFFTSFDANGRIYAAASSFTRTDFNNRPSAQWRYGDLGGGTNDLSAAGTVYRMDAETGAPAVWVVLPQQNMTLRSSIGTRTTGPGLGGIAYDLAHNQVAVANLEDGKIYLFNANSDGVMTATDALDIFDPLTADNGAVGMAAFGERVCGVEFHNGRLYYLLHDYDETTGSNVPNETYRNGRIIVRSVAVGAGQFNIATDRQEINEAAFATHGQSPQFNGSVVTADLEIDDNGRMAIGTFTTHEGHYYGIRMSFPYAVLSTHNAADTYNHEGGVYIYENNGSWSRQKYTSVGQETSSVADVENSTAVGGVTWNQFDGVATHLDDLVWITGGDFRNEDSQWGIIGYDYNSLNNIRSQENSNSYIQFLFDPVSGNNDPKGNGGDLDLFNIDISANCVSNTPSLEIGNRIWEDVNRDGIQDACEPPLPNIVVKLYNAQAEVVAIDTTDSKGEYYFNTTNITAYTTQTDTELQAGSTYYIVIMGSTDAMFANNQLSVGGNDYQLTTQNAIEVGHQDADLVDSDGEIGAASSPINNITNGMPFASVVAGATSAVDHSWDFGFWGCAASICLPVTVTIRRGGGN